MISNQLFNWNVDKIIINNNNRFSIHTRIYNSLNYLLQSITSKVIFDKALIESHILSVVKSTSVNINIDGFNLEKVYTINRILESDDYFVILSDTCLFIVLDMNLNLVSSMISSKISIIDYNKLIILKDTIVYSDYLYSKYN